MDFRGKLKPEPGEVTCGSNSPFAADSPIHAGLVRSASSRKSRSSYGVSFQSPLPVTPSRGSVRSGGGGGALRSRTPRPVLLARRLQFQVTTAAAVGASWHDVFVQ